METRLLIVLAVVVLIRIPFLNHAIQGDDVHYLAIARNALVDPLHPMQMGFTSQGVRLSMAGYPHPPLNAYVLALLLKLFGEAREAPFHAVYVLFSLIAAAAMYRLARRFTEHPLLATLLFVSVPAFVVNGNSLEADLPFLAFWMAGLALYFDGRHRLAAGAMALAAMGAYQAVFAVPILGHHAWYRRRRSKSAWVAVFAAPAALVAWQLFERMSAGQAPGGVLAGYLQSYGLLALVKKALSAVALTGHLGWLVLPLCAIALPASAKWMAPLAVLAALLPGYSLWQRGLLVASVAAGIALLATWAITLWKTRDKDDGFLAAWGLVFFAGAVAAFFAGSARYLLPLAPAAVFTVMRNSSRPWLLWPAALANLALGLALAWANYNHWDGYRRFAADLQPMIGERRVWTNAEWGLRYYLERIGAEPLERDQPVYTGSMIVTSKLAGVVPFSTGGGIARDVLQRELWSDPPVRIFGLGTRSGYSSSSLGVLPFDPGRGLLDIVTAEVVDLADPRLSYLRMNDPDAAPQLLSGFYQLEEDAWRWMGEQGAVLLRAPEAPARFEMTLFIPEMAPARRISVALDGRSVAWELYSGPGKYTLSAPVEVKGGSIVRVSVSVDKSFQTAGDQRRLGIIIQELGLR